MAKNVPSETAPTIAPKELVTIAPEHRLPNKKGSKAPR